MTTGAVSFFCLVEDSKIFRELDRWLISALFRAYKARLRVIKQISGKIYSGLSVQQLCNGSWYDFPAVPVETKTPSFHTAWRAARKSWTRHGLGGVDVCGVGYSY